MIIAIKKFVVQFAHNFYHHMKLMILLRDVRQENKPWYQKNFSKTFIHKLSIIEKNIVIHSSIVGNKCIAWILYCRWFYDPNVCDRINIEVWAQILFDDIIFTLTKHYFTILNFHIVHKYTTICLYKRNQSAVCWKNNC